MNDFALKWLILVKLLLIPPASPAFNFTLSIISYVSHGCIHSDTCESDFSNFCLRGPRTGTLSQNFSDCPLGTNKVEINGHNFGLTEGYSYSREITSDQPWPVSQSNCEIYQCLSYITILVFLFSYVHTYINTGRFSTAI